MKEANELNLNVCISDLISKLYFCSSKPLCQLGHMAHRILCYVWLIWVISCGQKNPPEHLLLMSQWPSTFQQPLNSGHSFLNIWNILSYKFSVWNTSVHLYFLWVFSPHWASSWSQHPKLRLWNVFTAQVSSTFSETAVVLSCDFLLPELVSLSLMRNWTRISVAGGITQFWSVAHGWAWLKLIDLFLKVFQTWVLQKFHKHSSDQLKKKKTPFGGSWPSYIASPCNSDLRVCGGITAKTYTGTTLKTLSQHSPDIRLHD